MNYVLPHTKTPVPTDAGYEFIVEMLTSPIAKQTVTFTTNSVSCIITHPLFSKIQELRPPEELKAVDTEIHGSKTILFIPKQPLSRQG
jgi:hypothetical protein